jgi:hypothetical protein
MPPGIGSVCWQDSLLPQSLIKKVSHDGLFLLRYEIGDRESDPRRITIAQWRRRLLQSEPSWYTFSLIFRCQHI